MFVPIWTIIIVFGAVGVVTWWGVLRLVSTNDSINITLDCIDKNLGKINERLTELETWMRQHEREDDSRYKEIKKETDVVWKAIDKIRGT